MDEKEQSEPACVNKLAFDTKEAAEGAALYATHRHGTKLKVYQCGHCRLWHLSSQ